MKEGLIEKTIAQFINAANAFEVKTALDLFATDALINDVSVGETFKNTTGVRRYLEQFFVGYHTVTKLETLKILSNRIATAQVDFKGDFGHETGALKFTFNDQGLITAIEAHLD